MSQLPGHRLQPPHRGNGQARRDTEGIHPQLPPIQPLLLKPTHSIPGQAHQRHLRGVCYLNREMAGLAGILHHVHVYLQVRKENQRWYTVKGTGTGAVFNGG